MGNPCSIAFYYVYIQKQGWLWLYVRVGLWLLGSISRKRQNLEYGFSKQEDRIIELLAWIIGVASGISVLSSISDRVRLVHFRRNAPGKNINLSLPYYGLNNKADYAWLTISLGEWQLWIENWLVVEPATKSRKNQLFFFSVQARQWCY